MMKIVECVIAYLFMGCTFVVVFYLIIEPIIRWVAS